MKVDSLQYNPLDNNIRVLWIYCLALINASAKYYLTHSHSELSMKDEMSSGQSLRQQADNCYTQTMVAFSIEYFSMVGQDCEF